MKKKLLSAFLSLSLCVSFVPAYAQNQEESTSAEAYFTDRFIIETKEEIASDAEAENIVTEEDVEAAINDVLSDMDTTTETSEVITIEDNSNVVTLTEEVNATDFIQAVSDSIGDDIEFIQPDYPIYLDADNEVSEENIEENISALSSESEVDLTSWSSNLAAAQEVATGSGVRVAVLGSYYSTGRNETLDYVVDDDSIIGTQYNISSSNNYDASVMTTIHSVAPDAQIYHISVFSPIYSYAGTSNSYVANTSDIVKGIKKAQTDGAQIVLCNWHSNEYNKYLEKYMDDSNMFFVSVAGKVQYYSPGYVVGDTEDKIYPASFTMDNMLAVSALNTSYNKVYEDDYDSAIDIYALGRKASDSSTYYSASYAAAYLTGAAALVTEANNSVNNMKNIIMNSAHEVSYMKGTKYYESYKALNVYGAVEGSTSGSEITISTQRTTNYSNDDYSYSYNTQPVYYENIKQVVAGEHGMAVLKADGTVAMFTTPSGTGGSEPNPFGLNIYNEFVDADGLSNVTKIAMSPDGDALAAVDEDGALYVWGNKYGLGLSGSTNSYDNILTPQTVTGITNVEDVYMMSGTLWVQTNENETKKMYSRGKTTCRSGEQYTFAEVTEAAGATTVSMYGSKVAIIKDGVAYSSTGSASDDGYFKSIDISDETATDIAVCSDYVYVLSSANAVRSFNHNGTASNNGNNIVSYGITDIAGIKNLLLIKDNQNSVYIQKYANDYIGGTTTISSNSPITSICAFGSDEPRSYNYSDIHYGIYALTADGTLYRGPVLSSNSSSYTSGGDMKFYKVAQSTFTSQAITSIVPANLTMEYGITAAEMREQLETATNNRVIITIKDPNVTDPSAVTDVSVPVTWNTDSYNPLKYGKQTFTGTLSLPEKVSNPNNLKAEANVVTELSVTGVDNVTIAQPFTYNTPLSAVTAKLPNKVGVTLSETLAEPVELDVEWDTSNYTPTQRGTQKFYGTLKTVEGITNPNNVKPIITIAVEPPEDIPIFSIDSISINANEGLLLNIGTKPNVGENPQTLVEVPSKVVGHTADLNDSSDEEIEMYVTWDDSNYEPFKVGIAQKIVGTVEVPEGYALASGVEPILYVTVLPRTYSVISTVPETPETTVLGGSSISDVNDSITNHKIGVEAIDEGDSSVVYFFADFEVTADNNEEYNPDTIGVQTVNGSFTRNNINMFDEGYIPVDVDVVSSPIDIVSTAEVNAYQSISLVGNENIPDTVNITLENDMAVTADVEWDFANYQKDIAGDQIITGRLVNLPSGVIQSTPERVATLIIHVTAVNYKITYADTPQETVNAKTEIQDLADNLSSDTISVELESVTDGITLTTTYDMPFTISEDDNTDYDSEFPDLYIINGQFTLPSNISNPDDVLCQIFLEVEPLTVVSIEPIYRTTTRGTAFADIPKPDEANVTLNDGSVEEINVDWGDGTGYISDSPELTEDHSIHSTVYGTLTNVPAYINYFNEPAQLIITVIKPRTYYISGISPDRIPTTGSITLNLGSTLTDIYNAIESHSVDIELVDGNNNPVDGITVDFTIEESDNASYSPTTVGEQTVIAHLNLPENIRDNGQQLIIHVNLVKRTVRSATVVRLTNIPYGTSFSDLGLPENAPVQFTDNTTGALPATWNSSTYNPNKTGAQVIRGTFNTPLPIYAENPNNRQPVAAVTIVQANTNIISAEPMETVQTQNIITRRLSAPRYTVLSNSIETDEIPGLRIRNYNVTMQHEDGSITTEIIPIFETVE